jgi:hypothetical protein
VTLDYHSANGGRSIRWKAAQGEPSTIDVFVNYELEVNVERDLDRAVDALNTDGPLVVWCDVAPRAEAPLDRPLGSEWTVGIGVGWSVALQQSQAGRRYAITTVSWGRDVTGDLGPGWLRGRLMWAVEVMPVYGQSAPSDTWGAGALPILWRWRFVPGRLAAPFAELGFGGLFTSSPVPEGTQSANFIGHGGFGIRWRPAARASVVTAWRFQHISNGNRLLTNPGVNAQVVWVGASWR